MGNKKNKNVKKHHNKNHKLFIIAFFLLSTLYSLKIKNLKSANSTKNAQSAQEEFPKPKFERRSMLKSELAKRNITTLEGLVKAREQAHQEKINQERQKVLMKFKNMAKKEINEINKEQEELRNKVNATLQKDINQRNKKINNFKNKINAVKRNLTIIEDQKNQREQILKQKALNEQNKQKQEQETNAQQFRQE